MQTSGKFDRSFNFESGATVLPVVVSTARFQVQDRHQRYRLLQPIREGHSRGEFFTFEALADHGSIEARTGIDAFGDHSGKT